jgi:nucleotidyltransferase substrate binding protein (TIGR01987 family)
MRNRAPRLPEGRARRDLLEGAQAGSATERLEAASPKEVFRQAFRAGWLASEEPWLAMIKDRNLIAHTYNEGTAERLRAGVDQAVAAFRELRTVLSTR